MTHSDDDLVDLYRRLPRPEPSAALDAAVLAQARAAVRARRPAWMAPLAAAAALVLAVGVGWQLRHEPLRESAPMSAPAPAASGPAFREPLSEAEADASKRERRAEAPARDAAAGATGALDASPQPPVASSAPATAPPPPPAQAASAERGSDAAIALGGSAAADVAEAKAEARSNAVGRAPQPPRVLGTSPVEPPSTIPLAADAPAPPPAEVAEAPPAPPAPAAPPVPAAPALLKQSAPVAARSAETPAPSVEDGELAARLDAIRALRDAGRIDEAVAELARLREQMPTLEVPQDLRDLLR